MAVTDIYELHRKYRVLYWQHNEMQLILADNYRNTAAKAEVNRLASEMKTITDELGYTPEA